MCAGAVAQVLAAAQLQAPSMTPTGLAQLAWACGWVGDSGAGLVGQGANSLPLSSSTPQQQQGGGHAGTAQGQQGGGHAATGQQGGGRVSSGQQQQGERDVVAGGAAWDELLVRVRDLASAQLHEFSAQDLSMLAQGMALSLTHLVYGQDRALMIQVGCEWIESSLSLHTISGVTRLLTRWGVNG